MPKIKFYTLGCKVNQYDTQAIRERFLRRGFQEINNGKKADLYLINTCTVTARADADSLNFIRRARRENPKARIIVTGCLTALDSDKIKKVDNGAVIVKKGLSPQQLRDSLRQQQLRIPKETVPLSEGISNFKGHTRAFLKVQDGCNNFCSYCKVPLVRGKSRSKDLAIIVKEAQQLVKNGFKEIVLCGICLGSYGKDLNSGMHLVKVIEALEKIEGLLRIRLSSIEAGDVSDELIEKMRYSEKLCPHLHIPIQSGDDEILKKMNRKYSRQDYLNLIEKIRSQIPHVAITTDILVGFPGENERNFQNTVELVKEIAPLRTHIFPYSKRERTVAANFKEEVDPRITKERISRLKKVTDKSAMNYKMTFVGRNMEVLFEEGVKDNPDFWQGYTANYIKVIVKSNDNLKNQLRNIKLKTILLGTPMKSKQRVSP